MSLGPTKFKFIGPDRDLCSCSFSNIEKVLHAASVIQATRLPNYKLARFPIKSGLNLPAWEKYLQHYPEERVLQYLKFGFPLSLTGPSKLHNVDVTNHFTALAHPTAIQRYLYKEKSFAAILGPSTEVNSQKFHCSPLLTRPKDLDKRRVILNLSYPHGASLNDNVDKEYCPFVLKFPSIDEIVQHISSSDTRRISQP